MYQPFSDGNTRTCLVLQKLLLSQKNLHIDLDEGCVSGHDLIGIMYDEYDVPKSAIEKVKRKVGIQQ